jgi:hypothetical protein
MNNLSIWKFDLTVTDRQLVTMPIGAKILSIQFQGGSLKLWALVDPEAETVGREIVMYGTGWPMREHPGQHLGTVQQADGYFVWHFFEPEDE